MVDVRHILSADQFTPEFILEFMDRAERCRDNMRSLQGRHQLRLKHAGKLMFTIFYQPSTRTRLSFGAAGNHLGLNVSPTENARDFSSQAKGENTKHTIQVLCGYYPDVIVLRHDVTGEVAQAASYSTAPIVNAGDGKGEHPTQAMLDLFTIYDQTERLDNLRVLMGGDLLEGRTIHSLIRLLSRFEGNELLFMAPPQLMLPEELFALLRERGTAFKVCEDPDEAFASADVVYWTRLQDPARYPHLRSNFVIGLEQMGWMRSNAILMHPMPIDSRAPEIKPEVESDPRVVFIEQAHNGLPVRMVLIDWVLGGW